MYYADYRNQPFCKYRVQIGKYPSRMVWADEMKRSQHIVKIYNSKDHNT
jgi:hypothetical protein